MRGQILGQLSERLSYDKLYQDAVRDPRLVRTRQELEVAIDNARTARQIVWELFQDLEGFRLDEYKQMDDGGEGMARLIRYFQAALARNGGKCHRISDTLFQVQKDGAPPVRVTTDRDAAKDDETLSLIGMEHPLIKQLLDDDRQLGSGQRAFTAFAPEQADDKGVLTVWHVVLQDATQRSVQKVIPLGLGDQGQRSKSIELLVNSLGRLRPGAESMFSADKRTELVSTAIPEMLRRDLAHKGLLSDSVTLNWRLLAWIEVN